METAELKERFEALSKQRNELVERLHAIQKDIGKGLDKDWEEQAVQLENAEVLDEIARVTSEELSKIEQSLERISFALKRQEG